MVATSSPVTLWSPSSFFFKTGQANISAPEFLDLINNGAIRVLGRREWLTDRQWRERNAVSKWEGYAWDEMIDGGIRAILEEDERKYAEAVRKKIDCPVARVMAVGAAPGPSLVDELTSGLTELERMEIHRAFLAPGLRLPPGVKQAAAREENTPDAIVRSVLIDAVNHAEAYKVSSARAPFFLDPPDSLFLERLALILESDASNPVVETAKAIAGLPNSEEERKNVRDDAERSQEVARKISTQILALLRSLEDRTRTRPLNLTRFVNGPGHKALVTWYSNLYESYQIDGDVNRMEGVVVRRLREDLDEDDQSAPLREILSDPQSASLAGASIIVDILSEITNPGDPFNVGSVVLTVLTGGLVGLRRLHWFKSPFLAKHWPYLYAQRRKPVRRREREIKKILDDLAGGVTR
jgi:hypothetical protein